MATPRTTFPIGVPGFNEDAIGKQGYKGVNDHSGFPNPKTRFKIKRWKGGGRGNQASVIPLVATTRVNGVPSDTKLFLRKIILK